MHLLAIEDDAEAAAFLAKGLRESGYTVDLATDGRDGLFQATEEKYDLLIVDRQLPHLDGLSIVQLLRNNGNRVPVLVLSALGSVDERIEGLRAGGDDYLTKPFAFGELIARIEALLRRGQATEVSTKLRVADLEMDLLGRTVSRAGQRLDLTQKEYQLLEFLMRRTGPGGDPDHAAGKRLGPALRSADQCDRRAHESPALGGRQGFRHTFDTHGAWSRLHSAG